MLTFFRNFFKTKIGLFLALAFLGLIGFAFASMDVSSTGTFGGVAGGDSVAVVGDTKIGTAELNRAANRQLQQAREENPDETMETFIARGGLEDVLNSLIDEYTIAEWGQENGFRAGTNLVNSEIRQIPAARGASGEFDSQTYQFWLRSVSLTDAQLRQQIRTSLMLRQTILPASYGAKLPEELVLTYARSFKERRTGAVASIPARLFVPEGTPDDSELTQFYADNRARFVRPERRTLRYAVFGTDALGDSIEPTDAEIAENFEARQAEFAASESRSFTQLIVPTREGAEAIAARVQGGESFAQAASSAGLSPAALTDQSQSDIRSASSQAVAEAYFRAQRGSVTEPAQGPLGWHVARVTAVTQTPARTLADVRDQIADGLREQKRQRGIAELAVGIEDRLAEGASLSAVAEELELELQSTPALTASGQVYGTSQAAPQLLLPILNFAFQIDEGEAQIGALPDQQNFLIYEVSEITSSAAPPLAEIREQAIAVWRQVRGDEGAEAAADRILERVEGGQSLAQAVAAEERAIPAPDDVDISREDVARLGATRVPAPLALMFGMAEGSVKKLEGSRDQGWYVVDLKDIALEELAEDDPLIDEARTQVAQAWSAEYAQQLLAAMRAEVGVERNDDAIAAVRRQLLGTN